MNQFYNNQYNKDAIEFFNEAAQTALNNSVALMEQNIEFTKETVNRGLTRMLSLQQFNSAEEVLDYQRKVGQDEFAELKKAGETYYRFFDNSNRELMSVAQKGRGLVENSFNDAAEKAVGALPQNKGLMLAEVLQNSVKTANDLFQNSFDIAMQVTRASADSIAKGQQAVNGQVAEQIAGKRKVSKK